MSKEIESLTNEISEKLQQLEKKIKEETGSDKQSKYKIHFPTGIIKTCDSYRAKYVNLVSYNNLSDVSYTLQLIDVLTYILERTDLALTAREMLIKYGLIAILSIIECSCRKTCYDAKLKPGKKLSQILRRLVTEKIFSEELYGQIDKLRDKRDKIHLHCICGKKGYGQYKDKDYFDGLNLLEKLNDFHNKKAMEREALRN